MTRANFGSGAEFNRQDTKDAKIKLRKPERECAFPPVFRI
jgi:hypothetical protein